MEDYEATSTCLGKILVLGTFVCGIAFAVPRL